LTEPDSQADLDTRRSEMLADNRLTRITGLIRGVGIFVVFLVALAGSPQGMWGEEGGGECTDYHIHFCIEDCSEDAGKECGEQISGCAGKGKIECRPTTWCPPEEEGQMSSFCIFDDTMN
jgi:hypothetical protein